MKYIFDGRFKVIREIMHLIVFLSSGLFGFYFLSDRQDHTTLIVFLITATVLGGFRILN